MENEFVVPEVSFFSTRTNRFYKLIPTSDWPTVSVSSVPMHKLSSPKKDAENKIRFARPRGIVLDTCMGLGYTAILSAQTAHKVITFENDDSIFAIARKNPYSQRLFSEPTIEIRRADISREIVGLEPDFFDCIIHDPPTFKLAGQLYSGRFYESVKRVLKKGGRFFHYTPLYKVKRGFDFPKTVGRRLKETGFKGVRYSPEAGGFLCHT
jgi:hypothetical protein